MSRLPVVALTGPLGSGKTTLLNHLLRRPAARVGVIVNDLGEINVDAGLLTGHIDAAASLAGGCVCCLDDSGGLDEALERLSDPRLRLDVVVLEASGVAEPLTLARLIRFSGVERVRPGGHVDVVDATRAEEVLDERGAPPARFAVATLVAITKTDLLPAEARDGVVARLRARIAEVNPTALVVEAPRGRLDPELVYDVAADAAHPAVEESGQYVLDLGAPGRDGGHHVHAVAVSVDAAGPVAPGAVLDVLEDPPPGVYRMKGVVEVATPRGTRHYELHRVGTQLHAATHRGAPPARSHLVAIGERLDRDEVHRALVRALAPASGSDAAGFARLQRRRRLSL